MLDDSDLDDVVLFGLLSNGGSGWGLFWLALLIVFAVAVCNNHDECGRMRCSDGRTPKLMSHQCLCVEPAR